MAVYPGAQRALFRKYHIGGCASCGFQPAETLGQVCARNNNLNVAEVLQHIQTSHEQDEKIWISPRQLAERRSRDKSFKVLDVRSRQEFEATHIEDSILMSQPVVQEIMAPLAAHGGICDRGSHRQARPRCRRLFFGSRI